MSSPSIVLTCVLCGAVVGCGDPVAERGDSADVREEPAAKPEFGRSDDSESERAKQLAAVSAVGRVHGFECGRLYLRRRVPADENGFYYLSSSTDLLSAFGKIVVTSQLNNAVIDEEWDKPTLAGLYKQHEQELRRAAQYLLDHSFQVPSDVLTEMVGFPERSPFAIEQLERLASILCLAAIVTAEAGNVDESLERLCDAIELGRRLQSAEGLMSVWIIGLMIENMACRAALSVVRNSLDQTSTLNQQTVKRVWSLVERDTRLFLERSLRVELARRLWLIHRARSESDDVRKRMLRQLAGWSERAELSAGWDAAPTFDSELTERLVVEAFGYCLTMVDRHRQNWRQEALFELTSNGKSGNETGEHIVAQVILLMSDDVLRRDVSFCVLSVGVLLGMHEYCRLHGELPDSLSDLREAYGFVREEDLVDPFDGKPLRYSKESRMLYSVGEDFNEREILDDLSHPQGDGDESLTVEIPWGERRSGPPGERRSGGQGRE